MTKQWGGSYPQSSHREMAYNFDDLPSEYQLIMAAEPQSPWVNDTGTVVCSRGPLGAWCGYAAVSRTHPWHSISYTGDTVDLDVHGGLTFSGTLSLVAPGDNWWWFGFDCAQAGDAVPGLIATLKAINMPRGSTFNDEVYRTFDYCRGQAERLAKQLAEIEHVYIQSEIERLNQAKQGKLKA